MSNPFYVTTPIYYVNDVPHIGHAYTSLAADVLARFSRLDGKDTYFLTGTDEHGQKVQKAAEKAGISPQEYVDKISFNFKEMGPLLDYTEDDFIRTTEERHIKGAQAFWDVLYKKGYIYLGSYKGWYSVRDEAFYEADEIVDGKAPTGAPVEWVEEPSYFFKLSAFQDKLLEYYEKHPDFIVPPSRRNEVISFVKGGLRDLSISRTSFNWGVPVPNDPKHVMYVWLDALTNYITALGYPENTEKMRKFWPEAIHLVGKDILRFHAVYWPAFLMAAELPLPKKVYAHGWWTKDGQKMSKSLGNVINPFDIEKKYGLDAVRYFLMREVPFGQDGDFSHEQMVKRLNVDLANDLGNLVQRVLSFIHKNAGEVIPSAHTLQDADKEFIEKADALLDRARELILEEQAFHRYLEEVWKVISAANKYVDHMAPWSLRKTDPERMETVLYVLCESIRKVTLLLLPVIPSSATKILDLLSVSLDDREFKDFSKALTSGTSLPAPFPVFPRYVEE